MRKIFYFLVFVYCASCSNTQTIIEVTDINDLTPYKKEFIEHFKKISIFANIQDMHDFVYYKDSVNNEFIEGNGMIETGEGKSNVLFRSPVYCENSDKGFVLITLQMHGESCTGVNCSKCVFRKKGGCKCEKAGSIGGGASYCNHAISK